MFFYTAYGLKIKSDIRLPELSSSEADGNGVDAVIRFERISDTPFLANGDTRVIHALSQNEIFLRWQNLGTFLVRGGHEVIIDPVSGFDKSSMRLVTLGIVLALLLHQRSQTIVLHASAVVVCGKAAIFMGHKGAGKSALAAALHSRQQILLADDITAISTIGEKLFALPGFPYFKLWPDSLDALGHNLESVPRLHPDLEKRGYIVDSGFANEPVPVGCIYALSDGSDLAITPMSPQEALFGIMPHWYGARFGVELLQSLDLSTHFRQCAILAKNAPVCRLTRPHALSMMMDVATLVEEHMHGNQAIVNTMAQYSL